MIIEITSQNASLALEGGLIIGVASALLLLFNGRVAGISGITNRLLNLRTSDKSWRVAFVLGLASGGFFLSQLNANFFTWTHETPLWRLAVAGVLVGYGSSQGGGCTSGHSVCGISRLSKRSIVATLTFMAAGFVTVFVMRFLGGLT